MMRNTYRIECPECHEIGHIHHAENDQPYSKNWERYSVSNMKGHEYYVEPWATWDIVFEKIRPSCIACDHQFTLKDFLALPV